MSPFVKCVVLPLIAVLGIGAFAVNVDLHNDEVQAAVLVLGAGGFVIGLMCPRAAWWSALLLGLSIPVGDYFAPRIGLVNVPPAPFNSGAFLALIPAFIGVYSGVGVRALIRGAQGAM